MDTLGEHRRNWVCTIGTTKKRVGVQFLYGVLLDDPRGVLRSGTGTLMTFDFVSTDDVDPQLVTEHVREAVVWRSSTTFCKHTGERALSRRKD